MSLILFTGACSSDPGSEDAQPSGDSSTGETGSNSAGSEDATDSETVEDGSAVTVVGRFEVGGNTYEFGWSSCAVEAVVGSTIPTKIVNATGTEEFRTMSLSVSSTPSPLGATQIVRVTVPEAGTYLLSQSLDGNGEVTDDLVSPGTTNPLIDPTGGLSTIEIDRSWQIQEGTDASAVPARLTLQCPEDTTLTESAGASENSATDDPEEGSPLGEPTTEVLSGSVGIEVAGDRYEATDVLCVTVPFTEIVVVNARGFAPDGSSIEIFVSNDPDDPEISVEGSSTDIGLSPDNGDEVQLQRTDNGVTGSVVITSGASYVGETLQLTVECDA